MRFVVDASVAVKWLLPEEHSATALRLVAGPAELLAPELLWVETDAALRKRLRRGDLSVQEFRNALGDVGAWGINAGPVMSLVRPAADMALHLDYAVYDCAYSALAEQVRWQVITADRPFHDKVERSLFAGLTLWIEDLPP